MSKDHRLRMRISHGKRHITITHLLLDKTNNAWMVRLSDKKVFKHVKSGSYRLTSAIYWLHTGHVVKNGEVIHHVDHDFTNNVIENFECTDRALHASHHHLGKKRSQSTRVKLQISAKKRGQTPEFKEVVSKRAKRQHREKNFGAHVWKRSRDGKVIWMEKLK